MPWNDEIQRINFTNEQISNKQIAKNILKQFRNSDKINDMITAQQYFLVRNTEIQRKTRSYTANDGSVVVNKSLSNSILSNAYLRNSVIQKVDYAFGKPFILSVKNTLANTEDYVEDEDQLLIQYKKEWANFTNDLFMETISRIATDAVNKGIGWVYVYIDENGTLEIEEVEPQTIYPAWADKPHTKLDAVVRDYTILQFNVDSSEEIRKVEYWDKETVEKFSDNNGDLIPDVEAELTQTHMQAGVEGVSWSKVPFIALKGNDDELPQLNVVKSFIDAHDKLNSKSVDTILDDIDAVLLLRGMSPEMGSLTRARQMLANSRIASVSADGDAKFLKVDQNIDAVEKKLESLKKNIREFTSTVDTQDMNLGSNVSGIALRTMYQDLDTYVNKFEKKFRGFMANLKFFFDKWLEFRGIGTAEQWGNFKLDIQLDRDMMINNTDLIGDVVKLNGLVSQETLDNYNPAVTDHKTETARRLKDAETAKENDELYHFNETLNKE